MFHDTLRSQNILRPVSTLLALGALSLSSACGTGSHELSPNKPMLVISEDKDLHFITAQESGGYPHYEDIFRFIIKQCDRADDKAADEDGCLMLKTEVSQETYEKFEPGDTIEFDSRRRGYPVGN